MNAPEIYGTADKKYSELIDVSEIIMSRMAEETGVVDIDNSAQTPSKRIQFCLDKEKAGLHGINTETVVKTLKIALSGSKPATVHKNNERTPLAVHIVLPRQQRSGIPELGRITIRGANGELVPLDEIGTFKKIDSDQPIFHKNLERVVYVFGETAGLAPAEAILDLAYFEPAKIPENFNVEWAGEGEWDITLSVFRDLGLAFGAAMVGIYILLIIQTSSFLVPLIIMTAIPLTAIGIIPDFWLLNLLTDRPVGGFDNPVFFTATAMIGMIALGGIVVRNSIVLIEFIQDSLKTGHTLKDAILESGAVRIRPILLTATTTALGALPITFDPVFSGLAWSLIFGLTASTMFTLLIVPILYYMIMARVELVKE